MDQQGAAEPFLSFHRSRKLLTCTWLVFFPGVSGWKCSKCDMRENLWLNLTDGSILCGRRYFDGSGGNNHAVEHFRETGYPLAVKLGTITPDGAGTPCPLHVDIPGLEPLLISHDTNKT